MNSNSVLASTPKAFGAAGTPRRVIGGDGFFGDFFADEFGRGGGL
jgi:hypothetical protein